jgi:glycosyltransferase involved in cell wall biosynthesis
MKLAIISRAENVSGKEIMTLELGQGLREQGHDVHFLTSIWNDGTYQRRLQAMDLAFTELSLGSISATLRWDTLKMTLAQMRRLPDLWSSFVHFIRQHGPERVVHTSWHHLLLLQPLLNPMRDYYWSHEVLPDLPHYRWVFMRLAKRLRGFVAVSHAVRDSLIRTGVPPHQVTVIHNGLSGMELSRPRRAGADGRFRIGIVGQVEVWKGHHDLLKAFATFAQRHSEAEVHVFGSGSPIYQAQLRDLAEALGLAARVHWHGYQDDRPAMYQDLDVCVVPVPVGATEALPTVAIEAAFLGVPVVACSVGGLQEIVVDGVTGLLVPAGDTEALAGALQQLMSRPDLRATMGAAAAVRARKHFQRDRFIAEFCALLQE